MQRTVQDVMTRDVVVAHESTPFHELVELLSRHNVSALPVVDAAGHVRGIVCDSDLVFKEVQTLKGPCDPAVLTARHPPGTGQGGRHHAREVMAAPMVTVYPEELVADAARRLHAWHLDQLPVVDRAGTLVGIISRADVLKVFLRSDQEIRFELLDEIATRLLRLPADQLEVEADGGVVTLGAGWSAAAGWSRWPSWPSWWTAWSPSTTT